MNKDSHTGMKAGVYKSSSFKFLNTNELVKILAADLVQNKGSQSLGIQFRGFPVIANCVHEAFKVGGGVVFCSSEGWQVLCF